VRRNWRIPGEPARSGVNRFLILVVRRNCGSKHILPRTNTGINKTTRTQFLQRVEVETAPLTLAVRRERAPHVRAFIPAQTEPAQILDDRRRKLRATSSAINVFDARDELATSGSRLLLRPLEGHGVAEMMKIAGGRWRDAAATDREYLHRFCRLHRFLFHLRQSA
jgi:hypothetical protein